MFQKLCLSPFLDKEHGLRTSCYLSSIGEYLKIQGCLFLSFLPKHVFLIENYKSYDYKINIIMITYIVDCSTWNQFVHPRLQT